MSEAVKNEAIKNEEIMIRVDHLSKEYRLYDRKKDRLTEAISPFHKPRHRIHSALRDINLEIRKGETVGIIGVNGSGKSTLLKILTGVVTPTRGTSEVKGRVSALLELGAGFNAEYTGMENIYLNGTMMNIPREEMEKLVPSIVEFADIGEFINQPVKNYSSGMFARLAFAVAISVKPDVLIVDEALSVGDFFFQVKCYKKFDEFREEGMTILFVSHDLNSISKYCSRTILLNRGELVAEGDPKTVVDLYKKLIARQMNAEGIQEEKSGADPFAFSNDGHSWKEGMVLNPGKVEYGDKSAEIIDFGIFDKTGMLTNAISKGDECTIRMKVKFNRDIEEPIFAFTIKNKLGIELAGTNTQIEGCQTGTCKAGEIYVATCVQPIMLQGGEYLLSFGCTGFGDTDLNIYHRLYDVCNFLVLSSKLTVGYFDLGSSASVEQTRS